MDRQVALLAVCPGHMGLGLAASDSRAKIMMTLTDTLLFLSHIMSALVWQFHDHQGPRLPRPYHSQHKTSTSGSKVTDCSRSSHYMGHSASRKGWGGRKGGKSPSLQGYFLKVAHMCLFICL